MIISVISPFVDKEHGTERALIELLERLARDHGVEIHLYAHRVSGLQVTEANSANADGATDGKIILPRVPAIPGPHLLQYLWWLAANQFSRWRDRKFRGIVPDLVYSPCINSFDARAVTVHIVFHAFYEQVRPHLKFAKSSPLQWLLMVHRLLYYKLIMFLEKRIYSTSRVALSAVSGMVSAQLKQFFGRSDAVVARYGVDTNQFDVEKRLARRDRERSSLGLAPDEFVYLLIGNDWKKKGLDTLLAAMALCGDLHSRLLIVGKDNRGPFEAKCVELGIRSKVEFLEPSVDVLQFYAAADAYVGPSLEDAYALPVLEAMASGLPVIASTSAGASEIISDGKNGLLLRDPRDAQSLAQLMRKLYDSPELARELAANGERTAKAESWDAHATRIYEQFSAVVAQNTR